MTDFSSVRTLARHEVISRGGLSARLPNVLTLHRAETLLDALRSQRIFLTIVLAYLVCGVGTAAALGRSISFDIGIEPASLALAMLSIGLIAAGLQLIRIRLVVRPGRPVAYLLAEARERFMLVPRWVNALPILAGTLGLLVVTTFFRLVLPEVNFFAWDRSLMSADWALHLGWHPWEITHAVAGSETATAMLDFIYRAGIIWALVMWVRLAFAARETADRRAFFVAFAIIWAIGGSMLGFCLPAAGPAFYSNLVSGTDPYAPLFETLTATDRSIGLWSIAAQQSLWASFTGSEFGAAAISAMPSLTCALLTLVTAALYRSDRWLARASFGLTIGFGLAAVHLGWNYALDCYVGAILALAAWSLARMFTAENGESGA